MIREYTPEDRKKIKHLYRDASFLEPTFSCYLDKHYKPFVYEKDGKIIGVIMLQQDYLMLDVFNLYVDIDHRGKDIGQALMSFAEEYARKKKLHGVKLETSKDNKRAQNFYLKCGYQKVGEVKNYRVKTERPSSFGKVFQSQICFCPITLNRTKATSGSRYLSHFSID